jgi:hypothetical protein
VVTPWGTPGKAQSPGNSGGEGWNGSGWGR